MLGMTEVRYRQWHPDHISYRELVSPSGLVGRVVFFDENLEGKFRIRFAWRIVSHTPHAAVTFRAVLPYRVELAIQLDAAGDATLVRHIVSLGYPSKMLSGFDKVIARIFFTLERQAILARHVVQEFSNLASLVREERLLTSRKGA